MFCSIGRDSVKVLPQLIFEDTVSNPPCASAMLFAMARPSPVPFFLYVTSGVKIFCCCSFERPQPLSDMRIFIWSEMTKISMEIFGAFTPATASFAFIKRFKINCSNFVLSQKRGGKEERMEERNSISHCDRLAA